MSGYLINKLGVGAGRVDVFAQSKGHEVVSPALDVSYPDASQLHRIIAARAQNPTGVFRPQPALSEPTIMTSLNLPDPADGAHVYFRTATFAMKLTLQPCLTLQLTMTHQYMSPLEALLRHAVPRRYNKHGLDFTYYGISRRHARYMMALGSMGIAFMKGDTLEGVTDAYPIVVEDFFQNEDPAIQRMLIDAVAVHEYGEVVLGNHHDASLLEFAIMQKEGKLGQYLEFLEKRYRLKFRDVVFERLKPYLDEALDEQGVDVDNEGENAEAVDAPEGDSPIEDPSRMLAQHLAASFVWPEEISEFYKIAFEEDEADLRELAGTTAETLVAVSYAEHTMQDGIAGARAAFEWTLERSSDVDRAVSAAKSMFVWSFFEHRHELDSRTAGELKGNARGILEAAFGEILEELNDMVRHRSMSDGMDRSAVSPFDDLTLDAILEIVQLEGALFEKIDYRLDYDYDKEWLEGRDIPPFEREIDENRYYYLHQLIWQAGAQMPDMSDLEKVRQVASTPLNLITQMPEKQLGKWLVRNVNFGRNIGREMLIGHHEPLFANIKGMSLEEVAGIIIARRNQLVDEQVETYRKNDPRGVELFGESVESGMRNRLQRQLDEDLNYLRDYIARDGNTTWNADELSEVVANVQRDSVIGDDSIAQFSGQADAFVEVISSRENPYEGMVNSLLVGAKDLGVLGSEFKDWDDHYKPLFSRALFMMVDKLKVTGISPDDRGVHVLAKWLSERANSRPGRYSNYSVNYPDDLSPVVDAIRAEGASVDVFEYRAWMNIINRMDWGGEVRGDHGDVVKFWKSLDSEMKRFETAGLMSAADKNKLDEVREKAIATALKQKQMREQLSPIIDVYVREGRDQEQNLLEMIYYLLTDSALLSLVGRKCSRTIFDMIVDHYRRSHEIYLRQHGEQHYWDVSYELDRFEEDFDALPLDHIYEWWRTAKSKKRKREGRRAPFKEKAAHVFMEDVLSHMVINNPEYGLPIFHMRMNAVFAPGMSYRDRLALSSDALLHARVNFPYASPEVRKFYEEVLRRCRAREDDSPTDGDS